MGDAEVLGCCMTEPAWLTTLSSEELSRVLLFLDLLTYWSRNFPRDSVQACFAVRLSGSSPALVNDSFT